MKLANSISRTHQHASSRPTCHQSLDASDIASNLISQNPKPLNQSFTERTANFSKRFIIRQFNSQQISIRMLNRFTILQSPPPLLNVFMRFKLLVGINGINFLAARGGMIPLIFKFRPLIYSSTLGSTFGIGSKSVVGGIGLRVQCRRFSSAISSL